MYSSHSYFAQAYGTDTYGAQIYDNTSSQGSSSTLSTSTSSTASAPNTGIFTSSDAVVATIGGALLVAIAIVGIVMLLVKRGQRKKASRGDV